MHECGHMMKAGIQHVKHKPPCHNCCPRHLRLPGSVMFVGGVVPLMGGAAHMSKDAWERHFKRTTREIGGCKQLAGNKGEQHAVSC